MVGPLEGITVLDLSWVLSGPFATMVLGDLGAEVIKIEHPDGGDKARGNGPHIDGYSSYFMSINRGKRSVTLNLATPRGRGLFLDLVKQADILLGNFTPGTMEKLGLDYETLRRNNSRLIYAAISGFGQTGPYASRPTLDIIVQSMSGMLSITGEEGGPPIRPGASIGDITASLYTVIGVLAALHERKQSGEGQFVDIGMLDCQLAIMENAFARYFATGTVPVPLGTRHPVATPFEVFGTKDGHVAVAIMGGPVDQWPLFCAAIDRVDLIDDSRFLDGWSRAQHYDVLKPIFLSAMKRQTTQEWLEELSAMGIACGPVNKIDQVAADPQVKHRNMVVDIYHPKLGAVRTVNSPIKMLRTPVEARGPAPDLGEHTDVVLREKLGLEEDAIRLLRKHGVV